MASTGTPRMCVYCASQFGTDPALASSAKQVGELLVRHGIDLVFGGGQVGLMGVVADTVMAGGGHVIGVIPSSMMDREIGHTGISELMVVEDMAARKNAMFQAADAFLTLPGGVGTMEEMFEMLSWGYLHLHNKPMGLLNVNGYYDPLIDFLDRSVDLGLTSTSARALLVVDSKAERLIAQLLPDRV
ncbi:MAG: TIGR00730 family Rossman fold protein [Microthrixaceae bacterium]